MDGFPLVSLSSNLPPAATLRLAPVVSERRDNLRGPGAGRPRMFGKEHEGDCFLKDFC